MFADPQCAADDILVDIKRDTVGKDFENIYIASSITVGQGLY